jgi:serine/threonine-protein kinase
MATVHFGRLLGPVGFARTVAIKRLHPQFAQDPEFVSMFLDEARVAARIRHPNVVPTLDVVAIEGELFLVMEYVQGEPLGALLKATRRIQQRVPVAYAVSIVAGALRGLHAAHEAQDEQGNALGIVHRDISPQNILVGVDGVARVLDFGVAKAAGRLQITREGQIKGKIAYMPPEQIRSTGTDRRTDIYAAGAVLWETLTGARLYQGDSDVAVFAKVLEGKVPPPSDVAPGIPPGLDDIVMRALAQDPDDRYPTARDMARALDTAIPLVPAAEIGEWVETIGAEHLASRTKTVSRIEVESSASMRGSEPAEPGASVAPVASTSDASKSSRSAAFLPPDDVLEAGERTEVSGNAIMHSAVIARVDRRWIAFAAGGVLVFMLIAFFALRSAEPPPASPVLATVPPAVAAPSPSLPVPAPAPVPVPVPVPPPPPVAAAPVVAPPAPPPAPTPVPAVTPVQAVTRPVSPPTEVPAPRPAPRKPPHALDGVLDSRK